MTKREQRLYMDERYISEGTVVIAELRPEHYALIEPLGRNYYVNSEDLQVRVEIAAAGLRGIAPELNIGAPELARFVEEFTEFEERRSGSVTLNGLWNLDELALTFAVVHPKGDVEVRARMKRTSWGFNKPAAGSIDLHFAIDPTSLPAIRDQFRALLSFQAPTDAS